MKSSYDHIPAFVVKTGGKEHKISTRSYSLDNYFDYRNGKVVYANYRPDARWGYRDYSELMLLDITTGQEHRITTKAKYFAPAFSVDGNSIVAVGLVHRVKARCIY
jgi:Tol biopolymer transport system component